MFTKMSIQYFQLRHRGEKKSVVYHYCINNLFSKSNKILLAFLSTAVFLIGCVQNSTETNIESTSSISDQGNSCDVDVDKNGNKPSISTINKLVIKSDCIIFASCFQEVCKQSQIGDTSSIVSEPRYVVHSVLFGKRHEEFDLVKLHFTRPWVVGHKMIWFYKIVDGKLMFSSIEGTNSVPLEKKDEVVKYIGILKR